MRLTVITALAGAAFLTGCASTIPTRTAESSPVEQPPSQLAFSPLTDPEELTKWSHRVGQMPVRVIDTRTFVVQEPSDDFDAMGSVDVSMEESGTASFESDVEPIEVEAEWEASEPVARERVIRHTINPR